MRFLFNAVIAVTRSYKPSLKNTRNNVKQCQHSYLFNSHYEKFSFTAKSKLKHIKSREPTTFFADYFFNESLY